MNELELVRMQTRRGVASLGRDLVRYIDALDELRRLTRILFRETRNDDAEVDAWFEAEGFGVDADGFWLRLPLLERFRAGEAPPDAVSHSWNPRDRDNRGARRRMYALRDMGPHLRAIHARLPGAAWIYYQDATNTALQYPYIDQVEAIPPDFDWSGYHTWQSVCPEANPERAIRWTRPTIDYAGEGLILSVSVPVYEEDAFLGLWSIDVPVRNLLRGDLLETFVADQVNFVTDAEGHILIHPRIEAEVGREKGSCYLASLADLGGEFETLRMPDLSGTRFGELRLRDGAGRDLVVCHERVEETGWRFFATFPRDRMLETVAHKIGAALERIRNGDLAHRIRDTAATPELRLLVDGYNEMAEALEEQAVIRRRVETALRRSEEHYRRLLDATLEGFVFCDEDLAILDMNQALCDMVGRPREDVLGRPLPEMLPPDDRDRALESLRLPPDRPHRTYETAMLRPGGERVPVLVNATTLFDARGRPTGAFAFLTDISELKRAEAALRRSEEYYRTVFEVSGTAMAIFDETTVVTACNTEYLKLSGYAKEEVVGRLKWPETVHPEDRETMLARHRARLDPACDAPTRYEFRFLRKDGTVRNVLLHLILPPHSTERMVSLIDLTESKRLEAELREGEKMRAIGQLAGGIAHDFNNQLVPIMGYAELLLEGLDEPELHDYARIIWKSSRRAADLTAQLLAFGRKGKHLAAPVDLHRMIKEVVSLLRHSLDKRIVVRKILEADPPMSRGDPSQLQNALLNLALNARDAMPDGGELSFATDATEVRGGRDGDDRPWDGLADGKYLRIRVADTGVGMDEATRRQAFEPFFTTKKEQGGTGMGLASAYGAVRTHHGAIRVESAPGEGSLFEILLPLDETARRGDTSRVEKPPTAVGGARVLLVDDEETARNFAARLLGKLGHEVTACADGEEAIDRFREAPDRYELVVLDLVMPRLGGAPTFRALRLINPDVRVLLVSGHSLNEEVQTLLDEGARGFVQKPFRMAVFAGRVEEALGASSAE